METVYLVGENGLAEDVEAEELRLQKLSGGEWEKEVQGLKSRTFVEAIVWWGFGLGVRRSHYKSSSYQITRLTIGYWLHHSELRIT